MHRYDTTRPINLDDLIASQREAQAQPRMKPREVLAQWLQNFGGGVGVTVVAGAALYMAGAPESWLWTAAPCAGLAAFGLLMAWRAGLDEMLDWRKIAQAKKQMDQRVAAAEAQANAERRRLELAYDAIEELEAANLRLTFERDNALLEVQRTRNERPAAARSTYTPAANAQPQVVMDATAIVRQWFAQRTWLSRRVAVETRKWSERRHDDAVKLLTGAGVLVVGNGGGRIVAGSEAEALGRLSNYCVTTNLGPPIEAAQRRITPDESEK